MNQHRTTSQDVASLASRVLQDEQCSDESKRLAASALSQAAGSNRKTSAEMASLASDVLNNPTSSETEKDLAASVLSQRAPLP